MRIFVVVLMILSLLLFPLSVSASAAIGAGAVGAVLALMSYYGYSIVCAGASQEDVTLAVSDLMQGYASYLGSTVSVVFPQAGFVLGGASWLTLSETVVDSVKGMIAWAMDGESEIKLMDSVGIEVDGVQIQDLPYSWDNGYLQGSGSEPLYCFFYNDYYPQYGAKAFIFSASPFSYTSYINSNARTDTSVTVTTNGFTFSYETTGSARPSDFSGAPIYQLSKELSDNGQLFIAFRTEVARKVLGGEYDITGASIQLVGDSTLPQDSVTTDVYVEGMRVDSLDDAGDYITTKAAENGLAIIQNVPPPGDDYESPGLPDVFPFCLPYDIKELLSVFSADPVAPVIHWPIVIDSLGIDYMLEVDLTPWEEVAALLRHLEIIVFVIGLAYSTRHWLGAE